MSRNGPLALAYHTLFVGFILAPILIVCAVAFTPEGFLSFPTRGLSLRWFRTILDYPEFLRAFRDSLPPSFATPELRIPCPEERKPRVVAEVAKRLAEQGASYDPKLGLRVETPDGWWLLRASGTEPKLTCRCESVHPDGLDRLRAQLKEQLALSGIQAEV